MADCPYHKTKKKQKRQRVQKRKTQVPVLKCDLKISDTGMDEQLSQDDFNGQKNQNEICRTA